MTGYLHPNYAKSLSEFGRPVSLPLSGGCLLERTIPGSTESDVMGCYPLFCCQDWTHLKQDILGLQNRYVSLALVADPFGGYDEKLLRQTFQKVDAFKSHFVIELGKSPEQIANKHHRYYARKTLAQVSVQPVDDLAAFHPVWCALYNNLVSRHGLTGIKAFSAEAFRQQLALDSVVALKGVHEGRIIGAHLWMVQGEVAYSHLAAFNDEGYDLACAYALYWKAIEFFTGKVKWLNIGAGAGLQVDADDGLTQFKRGWATGSRTAWFCASVLQPQKYAALCAAGGFSDAGFFPAYRQGQP